MDAAIEQPEEQTFFDASADGDTMGGRICMARDALGLSTAQLARRLGIKSTTLAGWEMDRAEPRSNKLVMLAGVLNVSPSWLLTGQGEAPGTALNATQIDAIKLQIAALRDQSVTMTEQMDQLIERLESFQHFAQE
ncbi:MAG: helix-turn-helix domain-containing protein [Pseudomonadota bacterium]